MKQEVSPVVAIVLIIIVLAVIGGVYYMKSSPRSAGNGNEPPPLPPSVGQTLGEIMSKAGKQQGQSAPVTPQNQGPQLGPGGIPMPPRPR